MAAGVYPCCALIAPTSPAQTFSRSCIYIAKRPRHEISQQTDPCRSMRAANNDAGAKDGETGKADFADGVSFIPITRGYRYMLRAAPCRRKQTKRRDSGPLTTARKRTDDANFKLLQLLFGAAHRTRPYAHTAHGADGALSQNFSGDTSGFLRTVP
jgi:hypothetical protein